MKKGQIFERDGRKYKFLYSFESSFDEFDNTEGVSIVVDVTDENDKKIVSFVTRNQYRLASDSSKLELYNTEVLYIQPVCGVSGIWY